MRRWGIRGKSYPDLPFRIIPNTDGKVFDELKAEDVYDIPPGATDVRVGGTHKQARIAFGIATGPIPADAEWGQGYKCVRSEKTRWFPIPEGAVMVCFPSYFEQSTGRSYGEPSWIYENELKKEALTRQC